MAYCQPSGSVSVSSSILDVMVTTVQLINEVNSGGKLIESMLEIDTGLLVVILSHLG